MKQIEILKSFFPEQQLRSVEIVPLVSGHINTTFKVDVKGTSYILQRLNSQLFRKPDLVAQNMYVVGEHLAASYYDKQIAHQRTNTWGTWYTYDTEGAPWRLMNYVANSRVVEKVENPSQAYHAALAFGEFYVYLRDLKPKRIKNPIPGFLDFTSRLRAYQVALNRAEASRLSKAAEAVATLDAQLHIVDSWQRCLQNKQWTVWIIHADPKISNVLFDQNDPNRVLAIIDWDTVMRGPILYEFGDMIRSYTNLRSEDQAVEEDVFSPVYYNAVKEGFLAHLAPHLTPFELENMALAARVVVLIQALRFLTDYLEGDLYYRVSRAEQNLDRCWNQLYLYKKLPLE